MDAIQSKIRRPQEVLRIGRLQSVQVHGSAGADRHLSLRIARVWNMHFTYRVPGSGVFY